MHNADFVLADLPWTRSLPFSKFLRNCGNVDLEKVYDHVLRDKLSTLLLEYDVRGQLLAAIKSLYKQSKVYVCVNGIKTKPFNTFAAKPRKSTF